MENMSPKTVLILVVVGIAIVGGFLLYSSGSLPQQQTSQEEEKGETTFVPETRTIAGRVTEVRAEDNSFVLLQVKEDRSFSVRLGEETEFVRLVFPFDLNNPPEGEDVSFTPEREAVTIEGLQVDDQVFIRSAHAIETGEDITDPLEVQILP